MDIDLTPQQAQLLELVLQDKTDAESASALGVSEKTIWNWRHSEPFEMALEQRTNDILDTLEATSVRALRKAMLKQESLMDDSESSQIVQLNASKAVVNTYATIVAVRKKDKSFAELYEALGLEEV